MSNGLKQTAEALGYAQYQDLSTIVTLTSSPEVGHALPGTDPSAYGNRPLVALLQAETQSVRWTDDGSEPDSSTGMVLIAGDQPFLYDGPLVMLKFIEAASGSVLNVSYYR